MHTNLALATALASLLRLEATLLARLNGEATLPPADSTIADAAEYWGDYPIPMKAYVQFDGKKWGWFFSPNASLAGAMGQPARPTSWEDYRSMGSNRGKVLCDLAGLNDTKLQENDRELAMLQAAHDDWHPAHYAILQSGEKTDACNLFVGDVLAVRGIDTTSRNGKYWTAAEIVSGNGPFREVPPEQVTRGDIWTMGTNHIEIVTSVSEDRRAFCSRGVIREPTGGEKCGEPGHPDDPRTFSYGEKNRFFRPAV